MRYILLHPAARSIFQNPNPSQTSRTIQILHVFIKDLALQAVRKWQGPLRPLREETRPKLCSKLFRLLQLSDAIAAGYTVNNYINYDIYDIDTLC
jgi:hypothetical protein